MILLWGIKQDETLLSVLNWLEKFNADFFFLDHSDIDRTHIMYRNYPYPQYDLCIEDVVKHMNSFHISYLRPYDYKQYDHIGKSQKALRHAALVHQLINSWSETSESLTINKASAVSSNNSKPYQAILIAGEGFKVPDSLITNDYNEIEQFKYRHKRIIYKSMSSVRSVVKEYTHSDRKKSEKIGPVLLQQLIAGKNVRVHIVGKKAFACSIESVEVDYRYGNSSQIPFEIPDDIAEKCIGLIEKLGMVISGIDFIIDKDGDWYCLEVNPNPGFSFYDSVAANEISRSLAQLLMN
jgi:ATP-grasp domain